MEYLKKYLLWLENEYFDDKTKAELQEIREDNDEIKDRFYKELEFGTGGLRGILGAGTNRMNIYTVRKATQGLANYIIKKGGAERGVAIAYDSRYMSMEFAEEVALCLAANDIKSYVFESLRPTPELSFSIRKLGCISGIVITASHNPPEYNGYKVYWEDGAQITAPRDKEIIAEVNKITDYSAVKTMDKVSALNKGLYHTIGKEIDDAYIQEIKKQIIHPEIIEYVCKDLKIVYSPFNGTGNIPVCRILKEMGFEKVYVVKEQQMPDPNFTTLKYPNPEDPDSFALALKLAKEVDADVILATDPDADRLGVYAKDKESGQYIPFTGNMSGMLIGEYILRERTRTGTMPVNPVIISTIVTTDMAKYIADTYNVDLVEVLTGFKYIGEKINIFEKDKSHNFVFGLEESYGCLVGNHARDKDAIVAVMCLCEVAAWCKYNGITLWNMMLEMYDKYGCFQETQYTITLKGIDGAKQIMKIMEMFRENSPKSFAGKQVLILRDYKTEKIKNLKDGSVFKTGLPISNVIYFELSDESWLCVRPSGTEPKIKFYIGTRGKSMEEAKYTIKAIENALIDIVSR